MRMWSRGLGKQNIGINLMETKVLSLDEALDFMLNEAEAPLLRELDSRKVIVLSGKILPPTGWEFIITLGFKDLFAVAWKLISWKTVKSLFFNSIGKSSIKNNETVSTKTKAQ